MSLPPTTPRSLTVSSDGAPHHPTHCRVAGDWGTTSQFTRELGPVLHFRLRVVSLIAVLPMLLFFFRRLLEPNPLVPVTPATLSIHAAGTVFIAALAFLLWLRPALPYRALRQVELALFASLVFFFAWLQLGLMDNAPLFALEESAGGDGVVRLWIENSSVRWFFLIVMYGVFIPNTWKRCAMLTGTAALLPVALTQLGAYLYGRATPDVGDGVLDLGILMATAWAMAVFGAYRLQLLQQQAFQAKRLGQYRLGDKLGAGGMGEVYVAEHVLMRRRCAIKLIQPDQTRDPATLARFEREVQAMATLTHPNTAEIYDYGRADDGTFYYVMEYLDGLNLESLVDRYGPLPPGRVIHFLRQVCQALREAHGIGLLHRDIKPSNIIACKRGGVYDVAKLLDFGLVQQMKPGPEALRLTMQGAILGSPPYMAPEQAQGRTDLDAACDIYSLGGVGYFLLAGRPPFVRETAMELMLAHAYEPVSPPGLVRPGVPEDLQGVILRCLSKKRDGRFGSAAALDAALAACADAGRWGEEQAAVWWRGLGAGKDTVAPRSQTVAAG
jgi:serine/threonine-protein kinase